MQSNCQHVMFVITQIVTENILTLHIFSKYSPACDIHFSHLETQEVKHFLKLSAGILRTHSRTMTGRSLTLSNLFPRSSALIVGNSQKSQGARSGEYGGCCTVLIPNSVRVALVTIDEWGGALSWCNLNTPSNSGRFFRTALMRSRFITCNYNRDH